MEISKEELEKNFEKIITKIKREKHPNEWKYVGRSGNEQRMALLSYMKTMSKEEFALFSKNMLVKHPEKTNNFLNELKINDFVGIQDTVYKVISKNENGFVGMVKPPYIPFLSKRTSWQDEAKLVEVSKPAIDTAIGMELGEILWRDEVPYGVDPEEEVELIIKKQDKKEET